MAKAPALPAPAGSTPSARSFNPQLVESRPREAPNDAAAIAEISRRRRGGRAAPPAAPAAPAEPLDRPGAESAAYSPLTGASGAIPGIAIPPAAPAVPAAPAPAPAPPAFAPAAIPPPAMAGQTLVEVLVNGQAVPVTLDELRRGYLRQQDYSAKTQALSDQMKAAQTAHAQFDDVRRQLESKLPQIVGSLADEFAQPIDWIKLAREDPIGYAQKDARHKQYLAARQEAANLAEVRRLEDDARKREMRRMGHEFLAAVLPGWADPVTRQQLQALQVQHLQSVGYSPDEIASYEALDPRQIVILEESRRFRALVAAHPELLRTQEMHPENPQARRVTPASLPGNGLLATRDAGASAETSAMQQFDEANRSGDRSAAREAAVSIIAARRARRQMVQ